jgi:hypothetical protein
MTTKAVSWQSQIPENGVAWGMVFVEATATVRVNGRDVVLYRMSDGTVKVEAGEVPELRGLMGAKS